MIALKKIYTLLKERLKDVPELKTVDWYNQQYHNMDEERAVEYPAVYVEFLDPINWKQSGNKFQYAEVVIKLHCVLFDLADSPVLALEFAQDVFETVNSKSLYDTDDFQHTTELVRVSSSFPKRYDQLKVSTIDFAFAAFDISSRDLVEPTNPTFIINP